VHGAAAGRETAMLAEREQPLDDQHSCEGPDSTID
jgi:hypothetical protein